MDRHREAAAMLARVMVARVAAASVTQEMAVLGAALVAAG
jgi:hypothetical protein